MSRDGPMPLSELRKRSLQLSARQAELRSRLTKHLESSGEPLGTVARKAGTVWATLNNFNNAKLCISSGQGLHGLCQLLDCAELGREIEELAEPIPDYLKGLGCFPESVVSTAVDLMEAQHGYADRATYAEFGQAFGEHAATVQGALKGSFDALEQLVDEEVQNDVLKTLLEDLDERMKAIIAQREQAQSALIAKLEGLVAQLLVSYVHKTVITKKLGLSTTALHSALSGRSSIPQLEMIIEKAEALLSEDPTDPAVRFKHLFEALHERYGSKQAVADALGIKRESMRTAFTGKNKSQDALIAKAEELLATAGKQPEPDASATGPPAPEAPQSTPAAAPAAPKPPGLELLEKHGGVTTEEGVQYVMTTESFEELSDVPLIQLRDALVSSLTLSRGLLNIGSQNADAQARKILQKEVGKQLKELELAIRAFTFAHPSELLELFDNQREVWRNPGRKPPIYPTKGT